MSVWVRVGCGHVIRVQALRVFLLLRCVVTMNVLDAVIRVAVCAAATAATAVTVRSVVVLVVLMMTVSSCGCNVSLRVVIVTVLVISVVISVIIGAVIVLPRFLSRSA